MRQPSSATEYLGAYADTHPEDTEPYTVIIKELPKMVLKNLGATMGAAFDGRDRKLPFQMERLSNSCQRRLASSPCWMRKKVVNPERFIRAQRQKKPLSLLFRYS